MSLYAILGRKTLMPTRTASIAAATANEFAPAGYKAARLGTPIVAPTPLMAKTADKAISAAYGRLPNV